MAGILIFALITILGTLILASIVVQNSLERFNWIKDETFRKDNSSRNFEAENLPSKLRNTQYRHHMIQPQLPGVSSVNCPGYVDDLKRIWRIQMNVIQGGEVAKQEVTWITQLDTSRIPTFLLVLRHWPGPVSASVFVDENSTDVLLKQLRGELSGRNNVAIHFVMRDGVHYPINMMRNVAVNGSLSEYVVLADVDFLPSQNASEILHNHTNNIKEKQVFVMPAFAFAHFNDGKIALQSKLQLWRSMEEGLPTHKSTNYTFFWTSGQPYQIYPDSRYEPYVLMRKQDVIEFPEIMLGYFDNKIIFFQMLTEEGYSYFGLPDVYVVHLMHGSTVYKTNDVCVLKVESLFKKERQRTWVNSMDEKIA